MVIGMDFNGLQINHLSILKQLLYFINQNTTKKCEFVLSKSRINTVEHQLSKTSEVFPGMPKLTSEV